MPSVDELIQLAKELKAKIGSEGQIENPEKLGVALKNLDEVLSLLDEHEAEALPAEFHKLASPADDLTKISSIDGGIEGRLNVLRVTQFDQIASWGPQDVKQIDHALGELGLPQSGSWIEQAAILASGKDTFYSSGSQHPDLYSASIETSAEKISDPDPLPAETHPSDDTVRLPNKLTLIRGLSTQLAGELNALNVTRFEHIANWTAADVTHFSDALDIGSQIQSENWIEQAAILAHDRDTVFSRQPSLVIVSLPMDSDSNDYKADFGLPAEFPGDDMEKGGGESQIDQDTADTPGQFPEHAAQGFDSSSGSGSAAETVDVSGEPFIPANDESGWQSETKSHAKAEEPEGISGNSHSTTTYSELTDKEDETDPEDTKLEEEPVDAEAETSAVETQVDFDSEELAEGSEVADRPQPDFSKMSRPVEEIETAPDETIESVVDEETEVELPEIATDDQNDHLSALMGDTLDELDFRPADRGETEENVSLPSRTFPGWSADSAEIAEHNDDDFYDDVKIVVKTEESTQVLRDEPEPADDVNIEQENAPEFSRERTVFPPFADFNVASGVATDADLDDDSEESAMIRDTLDDVRAIPQAGLSEDSDPRRDGVVRRFFRVVTHSDKS